MLDFDEVVTEDNEGKVLWCRLVGDGGDFLYRMRICDTCEKDEPDMVLYHFDTDSDREYRKGDVLFIEGFCDDEDTQEELNSNEEYPINNEALKPYEHSDDVYKFSNKLELLEIYKHLNEPIIHGITFADDTKYLNTLGDDVYGIVFYWTEYDDWSCGHPYSYFMKIVFGVKGMLDD